MRDAGLTMADLLDAYVRGINAFPLLAEDDGLSEDELRAKYHAVRERTIEIVKT